MRSRLSLLLVAALLTLGLTPAPVVRLYLFYAEDCGHCKVVMEETLPDITARYPIDVTSVEINDPANYRALLALEERLGKKTGDIPVVVVGDTVLSGEEEVTTRLEETVAGYLAKGGVDLIPIPTPAATPQAASTAAARKPFPVGYFSKPGCQECERVRYDLAALAREMPLAVTELSVADRKNLSLLEAVERALDVPERQRLVTPAVVVGRKVFIGKDAGYAVILQAMREGDPSAPPMWETIGAAQGESGILERFQRFSFLPVIWAGLVDGVNPCAFATLIFFLSYLSLAGRKGRDLIIIGGLFTVAVFLTYLLIGLGVFTVLEKLTFISVVSRWVYRIMFVVALVLGALSLYDWNKARKGQLSDIALQLPAPLKKRIHGVIRERVRLRNVAGAAFVTGVLVSLLELACTGQVYLPTILFVAKVPGLRSHAAGYLILYNLMFILPLVVVFALTYLGMTSQHLTQWMQRHAATVKLATAALFFSLAGLMASVFL